MTLKPVPSRIALGMLVASVLATSLVAQEASVPETVKLQGMTARFAPTEIAADLSTLSAADRQVLAKLVEASKIMDALFLRQVWAGNEAMLLDLVRDQTPEGRARLHYFLINKGPWSRLDHDEPFVPGAPAEAGGRELLSGRRDRRPSSSAGSRSLPRPNARARTRILHRRFAAVRTAAFSIVPYNVEYQNELARAAALLREAAALTTEPTLKTFLDEARRRVPVERLLRQRRRLDGAEGRDRADHRTVRGLRGRVVQLQGGVRGVHHRADEAESAKLQKFGGELQDIENHLPIDPKLPQSRSSAPWRRSPSSTRSSRPATAIAACRRRRSTCRTTSACVPRRAPSASC